ncbi:unnamed protein product [Rotaria magnacalcarata]|uniref:F-box domain-containing protein n=1 Tax=Rotaria magnacalcarata TaxID=392030 RepID=A0A818XWL5_9BILA|nr:unnamed protein product [Rotaria magnacalcarata]
MSTSMAPTHFMSLPDITLLEIFTYLSSEDVLYTFADLHDVHLIDLLTEHAAFRQICLSSQLSRGQYKVLSNGIWRYDSVCSFVCKEMFCDFITDFTPCPLFPSLTELRILGLRCITDFVADRLKLLDTDSRSYISIQWNQLTGCLQSLEHLFTYVERMSDDNEDESKLHRTWFTSAWTSWTIFWMNNHNVAPHSGVRHLGIGHSNILLHSIGKLFSNVHELTCQHPGSLSIVDSSLTPTPLINLRHLRLYDVVPELELLFDGIMLPHLHSLHGFIVPLFVALAGRANQTKTLDTVDHLVIIDHPDLDEWCFSFKQ